MSDASMAIAAKKPQALSRIGNGSAVLPSVDGRSTWARLFRDTLSAVIAHCGGSDAVSELERIDARRIAGLEAELIFLEDKFATTRAAGGEPEAAALDLYARLANSQRRLSEALGWQRRQRDVTGSLADIQAEYVAQRGAPAQQNVPAAIDVAGMPKTRTGEVAT